MAIVDGEQIYHNNFNAIIEGLKGNGVISGMVVSESSPTAMTVSVAAGTYVANGTTVVKAAITEDIAVTEADAVKPRKDLIVGDAAGNLTAVAGTPVVALPSGKEGVYAQYPMPPDIPENTTLLGEVWVEEAVEEILDVDITDRRLMVRSLTGTAVVAASDSFQKASADYVCNGTADDVEILAALALGPVFCLKGTYNTTSSITLTDYMSLRFESGSVLNYTGADSAVILNGDFIEFVFDRMYSVGHTANYGIKVLEMRFSRVVGNMIGPLETHNNDYFVIAGIWFDAANAGASQGGNFYDIVFINRGQYGIKLDSVSGKGFEGNTFRIGVIMRASVVGAQIGTDDDNDKVIFNTFWFDIDPQSITPQLINFKNSRNFVLLEHWGAPTSAPGIEFAAKAFSNTVVTGVGTALSIHDPSQMNSVIRGRRGTANLVHNGNFELALTAPAGWTRSGVASTSSQSTAQVKWGTYSALLTRVGNDCELYQDTLEYLSFQGRYVTLSAWVYATVADRAKLRINDGVSDIGVSSYHSGVAGWEWLTCSGLLASNAIRIRAALQLTSGDTSAYFDAVMLTEGQEAPYFAPPPNQHLIAHYNASHTISAHISGHAVYTNQGATGAITFSLPQTVEAGLAVHFVVMAAYELRIDPGAAGAIYINGAKQTDDKYISADDEGESVTLVADGNGDWAAVQAMGTWTVEV